MYKNNAKKRVIKRNLENLIFDNKYIFLFIFLIILLYKLV